VEKGIYRWEVHLFESFFQVGKTGNILDRKRWARVGKGGEF
jgi:hypothetical protein